MGESNLSRFLGFSSILLIICFGLSLTLELKLIGILIGIALIIFAVFLFTRMINSVTFTNNFVLIKYFGFQEIEVEYENIRQIYLNHEGFLNVHVYVVKYKFEGGTKKFTFYCRINQFAEIENYLKEKGIKIMVE